jgi:Na+:H+ antiporter, NhaA family
LFRDNFQNPFDSEKSSGILLIICAVVSLVLANSILGANYLSIWQMYVGGLSVEHWVNYPRCCLELEREPYSGELSNFKNALLPNPAAIGGIAFPALIHFSLNRRPPNASPLSQATRTVVYRLALSFESEIGWGGVG